MRGDPASPGVDIRLRIVGALLLAFVFSAMHNAAALAAMTAITLGVVALSGFGWGALLRRLQWPGLVVGAVVLGLAFVTGSTPLVMLGPIVMTAEGVQAALAVALRFLCIFALVTALLAPVPVPKLIAGLRALGVPALIADMALLALRHLSDMRAQFAQRETALRLRGARARSGLLQPRGWMLASLLLHSHARSERVWQAMRLRGHGARGATQLAQPPTGPSDKVWLVALIAAALALLLVEHLA